MAYAIKALVADQTVLALGLDMHANMVIGHTNTNKQTALVQSMSVFSPFYGHGVGVRKFGKAWAVILQIPDDIRLYLARAFDVLIDAPSRGDVHLWSVDKIPHLICSSMEQASRVVGNVVWFYAISYGRAGNSVVVFTRNS